MKHYKNYDDARKFIFGIIFGFTIFLAHQEAHPVGFEELYEPECHAHFDESDREIPKRNISLSISGIDIKKQASAPGCSALYER